MKYEFWENSTSILINFNEVSKKERILGKYNKNSKLLEKWNKKVCF